MSRTVGAQQVVAMGAAPVGALLGGGVAEAVGFRAPAAAGVLLELIAFAVLVRHLVTSRRVRVVHEVVA
jgi:predicted MFS family arabinose efflux permease